MMTHAEEYDAMVGSYEEDDGELCRNRAIKAVEKSKSGRKS